jgi:two-component system chemotaxis sensor kinase CheA
VFNLNLSKDDLIQIFLDEAIDHINNISSALLELEKDPDNNDLIQLLFRGAHTLKGNSSTCFNTISETDSAEKILEHLDKTAKLTHSMEDLITEIRDNGLQLTGERLEVLFDTANLLELLVVQIQKRSEDSVNIEEMKSRLLQAVGFQDKPATFESIVETPLHHKKYEVVLNCDPNYKHAFTALVYQEIEQKYPTVRLEPDFDFLMSGKSFENIFIYLTDSIPEQEVLDFISARDSVQSIAVKVDEKPAIADKINNILEELKQPKPIQLTNPNFFVRSDIRVALERVDSVLKHVSSLVILKNKLIDFSKDSKTEESAALISISEDIEKSVVFLQESVMKIRMTPLEQLFNRFPKDVRNISKEYGKKVNFVYQGADTEMDKSLLDQLPDPLMHLIRNSIFHGLETEIERIETGKNPIGNLTLSAKHEQGWVVITVEDDGSGIPVEKVAKKALERGLITEEKLKSLSDHEIINFIFHPGLSTADAVTSVAGRGVGMDAVRSVIEDDMKGSIQVYSEKGKGTKNVIKLPLTLAIIDAMLATINDDSYAFPLSQVEEVVSIHPSELKYVLNKEVLILRDLEIPVVRLREFFNIPPKETKEINEINLVIVKSGEKMLGLVVDRFTDRKDIVVKNIGRYLGNIPGINSCTILGDASISLIVDVNSILSALQKKTEH